MSEILYLLEMMNGAEGICDIEGKATRVGASERGQRMSFKTAVLFGVAALSCVPCVTAVQSGDERLRAITQKNGNGAWSSFPASKESKNRFPIGCRG
jgi:hypothetical protein